MAPDAEFKAHMTVCNLRFAQQAEQNKAIERRLQTGDELMQQVRDLLIKIAPMADEVKLHSLTIYGQDRDGGLVREVRDTKSNLDRINRAALAVVGLFTTNIGTLVGLLWMWLKRSAASI